ncbi:hypothetical protein [Clostridium sp. 001]|uniref:hypothetical protein n=1 Tax=Clostridium sp. 001 TaxID=1970093 RepID=UPI001C2BD4DA|nr:hypothetical protein [Clostridium sp. 001]QXE17643.1 hypothetical protein B5S50_01590 [Clostridium sp. 001]
MNEKKKIIPQIGLSAFVCEHCGAFSQQVWTYFMLGDRGQIMYPHDLEFNGIEKDGTISISTCQNCHEKHIWYKGKLVFPQKSIVPIPNEDMPEKVKKI